MSFFLLHHERKGNIRMKKNLLGIITIILLVLITGNFIALSLILTYIPAEKAVAVNTADKKNLLINIPHEFRDYFIYKIKNPDVSFLFNKNVPKNFYVINRSKQILRVQDTKNEVFFSV